MILLNSALAFGGLAFLIPIAIHLMNRSRFRTVEWGAMHLLESVIKVNHKRFQFDQLILLLVRCMIPLLLAFCIARPLLTGGSTMEGNAPVSLLILLDNSYSMDVQHANGSRYEKAIEAAKKLIAATPKGSEISIIQSGGLPVPLFDRPVFDQAAVIRKLDRSTAGMGATMIEDSMNEAISTLRLMSHARRELIVISDFQDTDWQSFQSTHAGSFAKQFASMPIPPGITFLQVGEPIDENISINSIESPNRAIGVGERMRFRVNLQNHGKNPVNNSKLVFKVDGRQRSISQFSIASNSTAQVLFTHQFESPGSHIVTVETQTDDPLRSDNQFSLAVTIWESIDVILVDGDPSSEPLKDETGFLSVALTPFTLGRSKLMDVIEAETILPGNLTGEAIQSAKVIMLANVAKVSDAQLSALESFVEKGGVLFVFPGDRLDLSWYREKLFKDSNGLLPSPFGNSKGIIDGKGNSSRIIAERFEHPSLSFFNERENGDLSTATINRWLELSDTTAESQTSVLAKLNNGDPFLMEKQVGDGVIIQMATTCDADWNDLPLQPVFVPLIQQMVSTVASRLSPPRNITTGEPAIALLPDSDSPVSISVLTPQELRISLDSILLDSKPKDQDKVTRRQIAKFTATQHPGVYEMALPNENVHFVAEASRSDSKLAILERTTLKLAAEAIGGTVCESAEQYLSQDRLRRHGREIWKYLLFGFLAFLFLEMVLQQRFARVKV